MKLKKCFKQALNMVLHSRLRSWLTIIGIVIGIASVIAIVSLGQGMSNSMSERFADLDVNLLTISPGHSQGMASFGRQEESAGEGSTLGLTDVQILKSIPDIKSIDKRISGRVDVYYQGEEGTLSLTGVDQSVWATVTSTALLEGRMLGTSDRNVIVIGSRLAEDYFDKPIGLNQIITIEGGAYRVVGILDDDGLGIYIPIETAYALIEDKEKNVYDTLVVQVDDDADITEVTEKIESKLMLSRHVTDSEKDFTVTSSLQMQETVQQMTQSLTLFLAAIAAVSLLVGAVGIANTMFTSVLEKTKEIGILKSIGAKNEDIMKIFIIHSGLIGLIGGLIGVLFGVIVSKVLPYIISFSMQGTMETSVSISIVMIALVVSFLVGIISGIIPAFQASKLKPVDALRFE